jgi:hypothetical protein
MVIFSLPHDGKKYSCGPDIGVRVKKCVIDQNSIRMKEKWKNVCCVNAYYVVRSVD